MILQPGSKVLIAHRRLFETDHVRYFTGVIEAYQDGLARITGTTWLRDGYRGLFKRKQDLRTKIISLVSGTVIAYQLPSSVRIEELRIDNEGTELFLRDDSGFEMDLTEGVLQHLSAPMTGHVPA